LLTNLVTHAIEELAATVNNRLKRIQHRPGIINETGSDTSNLNPVITLAFHPR
jgi:hypothetical protein